MDANAQGLKAQSPAQELTYAAAPISGFRRATWIMLLVVGILTIFMGTCIGVLVSMAGFVVYSLSGGASGIVPAGTLTPWYWMIAVGTGVPFAAGVINIVCSIGIRRGSRAAAITAIVVVGVQLLAILAIMVVRVWAWLGVGSGGASDVIVVIGFYGVQVATLGVMEWLLLRVLREMPARLA